ncbi:preprotein translocase subunit SecE [bacterium]|nr:preprotein translocase subunit SecE [bacterium]MBU1752889.1 preprotein translocase subunit SecE [bacterium]
MKKQIIEIIDKSKKFFREVWVEVSPKNGKVSWPTKKVIMGATGVVIVCVAIIATYIWIVDTISITLLSFVMGR